MVMRTSPCLLLSVCQPPDWERTAGWAAGPCRIRRYTRPISRCPWSRRNADLERPRRCCSTLLISMEKSRIPCGILSVFPSFSNSPVDSNPRFNRTRSKINFCETCCDGSGSRLRAQSIVMPGHYKALSDFICRLVYFWQYSMRRKEGGILDFEFD